MDPSAETLKLPSRTFTILSSWISQSKVAFHFFGFSPVKKREPSASLKHSSICSAVYFAVADSMASLRLIVRYFAGRRDLQMVLKSSRIFSGEGISLPLSISVYISILLLLGKIFLPGGGKISLLPPLNFFTGGKISFCVSFCGSGDYVPR